jgi:hypothetical protein
MMSTALLAFALVHALELAGDSTCPAASEVRARLSELPRPSAESTMAPRRAQLSSTPGTAHVELLDERGSLLAERTLARTGTCSELAEAVAVVLASWQAELDPKLATAVGPLASPRAAIEPIDAQATAVTPATSEPAATFDLAVAPILSVVDGDVAFGARVESTRVEGGPLGAYAGLSATTTRSEPIPALDAAARWQRVALALGPNLRVTSAHPGLDLRAGAVVALLHVEGSGVPRAASDSSVQLGLTAGLRALWSWQNAAGWAGADVFYFPGHDRLSVGNYGEVGRLPRTELQLSLGMALGRFE